LIGFLEIEKKTIEQSWQKDFELFFSGGMKNAYHVWMRSRLDKRDKLEISCNEMLLKSRRVVDGFTVEYAERRNHEPL
jgi:hypothetical protein